MLAVQMRSGHSAQEKLRTIGVGACIRHGQDACPGVFEAEVLVVEFPAIDGLASSAIEVGEVTALAHEVGYDPMESGA